MINLKLLFIILDEGYDKKINNILNKFGIKIKTVINALGTASPSILDYFGLTETNKEIFISVIPDYLTNDILEKINNTFNLNKAGTGISFTVPISSSNKFLKDSFDKDNIERITCMNKNKYHLIMTIVAEGFLEEVMTAAKKAGTNGGTVINGRTLSNKKNKILSFNIEPERDIILNIVPEKNKTKVMEEITKEVGIKTEGKGICLSLPVDNILGFERFE